MGILTWRSNIIESCYWHWIGIAWLVSSFSGSVNLERLWPRRRPRGAKTSDFDPSVRLYQSIKPAPRISLAYFAYLGYLTELWRRELKISNTQKSSQLSGKSVMQTLRSQAIRHEKRNEVVVVHMQESNLDSHWGSFAVWISRCFLNCSSDLLTFPLSPCTGTVTCTFPIRDDGSSGFKLLHFDTVL